LGLFGVMISNLISAIPITPGAVGQFDGMLYGILTVAGVNEAEAGLGVILLRVVSLWTLLPVCGLITYLFGFSRALNLSPTVLPKNEPLPSASPLEG
ncbi:MAG: flippase-like domain-containing protein, partial [Anaerolineae bacterium]|nr:flippase-like domain-containing protein [Anaerolineae bacterium]